MYLQHPTPRIYINWTPKKGRGVFASEDISRGELIEICPVIVLIEKDTRLLDQTILYEYYFLWENGKKATAILLGFGSIYNHSDTPNAETTSDLEEQTIAFTAIQDIKAGEEIVICYNDPNGLWFKQK